MKNMRNLAIAIIFAGLVSLAIGVISKLMGFGIA
jgi:hypothetical protein